MAELPEVVLKEIFDFLGVRERLRVRSTCKKWKFVADNLSHQQSVCIYSASYPFDERWCFSDQRVTDDEMLYLEYAHEPNRSFDLRMEFFRNLRKVCLHNVINKTDYFLEEINQLTKLKVLMIDDARIDNFRTLNSPTLEKLSLKCVDFGHLQLNTPNLSSLVHWKNRHRRPNQNVLVFGFPLQVRHLECIEFTRNLGQLKNLETLVCVDITFDFKLNEFKSLTRTELWSLNAFRMVQNEKRRLERTKPQIIASGFDGETIAGQPLNAQRQFFCDQDWEKLQITRRFLEKAESNRWNLTGSVPWRFNLNLEDLGLDSGPDLHWEYPKVPTFKGKIPGAFFDKFRIDISRWRGPLAKAELDEPALIELAERCRTSKICLGSRVGQDTFERLCRIQSIKTIRWIRDIENPDCLLNLKNLEYLEMNSSTISIRFICRMLKELKFLYFFRFEPGNPSFFTLYFTKLFYLEEEDLAGDPLYHLGIYYTSRLRSVSTKQTWYSSDLDDLIKNVIGLGKIRRPRNSSSSLLANH